MFSYVRSLCQLHLFVTKDFEAIIEKNIFIDLRSNVKVNVTQRMFIKQACHSDAFAELMQCFSGNEVCKNV